MKPTFMDPYRWDIELSDRKEGDAWLLIIDRREEMPSVRIEQNSFLGIGFLHSVGCRQDVIYAPEIAFHITAGMDRIKRMMCPSGLIGKHIIRFLRAEGEVGRRQALFPIYDLLDPECEYQRTMTELQKMVDRPMREQEFPTCWELADMNDMPELFNTPEDQMRAAVKTLRDLIKV